MPEVSFDLKSKHPLLPHPEVTRLHQENKFKYDKTLQDRNYDRWYDEVKKVGKISTGEITILVNQIFRIKHMNQDYIFYDASLYGTDRSGNKLDFDIRFGRYEKPIFRKKIDQRTDEIISHEIVDRVITYDIEYTPEVFDSLLEQAKERGLSLVVVTEGGGGRSYNITNVHDFRDATHEELIEIGQTGKSLATMHKLQIAKEKEDLATILKEQEQQEQEQEQEKAVKPKPKQLQLLIISHDAH